MRRHEQPRAPRRARTVVRVRPGRCVARRAALSAALAGASAAALGQTPPVFRTGVETVYVDAFVTDRGRPITGLTASEFELKDNGARQEVELVTVESLPLLAVLVFDTSGSMAGEKLLALRAASAAFLEGLRPADEAALLTFSQELRWRAPASRDRDAVLKALAAIRPEGATAALDALYAGLTLPDTKARTLVVLFTDGEDNMSWLGESEVRGAAERSNALIHVVGLLPTPPPAPPSLRPQPPTATEPEHVRMLRQIAETTGGRFWEADSPSRLKEAFAAIVEAMNSRYVLSYEPQRAAAGWHRIELRLKGRKSDVHARRGYWVGAR